MSIPSAVKKAAEAVDQRIREMQKPVVEGEPAPEVEPEVEPPTEPVVEVVPSPPSTEDWETEAKKWEQRYKSLAGMLKQRDMLIEQQREMIAALSVAATPEPQKPAESRKRLVTEKDEEAYGADLIELNRRIAREEVGETIDRLERDLSAARQKIAELEQGLTGVSRVTAETAVERFHAAVAARVPNMAETNVDPKFTDWLKSAPSRWKLWEEGLQSHDVEAVVEFFLMFQERNPPAQSQQTQLDEKRKAQLEKQVSPGKPKQTQAPVAPEKKVFTMSEVKAKYAAYANRQIRREEFEKFERDYYAAKAEGRFDPNR